MHISALEEYGLRCALQLASLAKDQFIAASQIADREGISVQYASKIMHLFRKAGLAESTRGIQGGFRLARTSSQITVKEVFASMQVEQEKETHFCNQFTGQQKECVHLSNCNVRPVWQVLFGYFDVILDRLSLEDLVRSEAESRKKIENYARMEADKIKLVLTGSTR